MTVPPATLNVGHTGFLNLGGKMIRIITLSTTPHGRACEPTSDAILIVIN
jgi:hypothetical protein